MASPFLPDPPKKKKKDEEEKNDENVHELPEEPCLIRHLRPGLEDSAAHTHTHTHTTTTHTDTHTHAHTHTHILSYVCIFLFIYLFPSFLPGYGAVIKAVLLLLL